jgi:two-component system phosphate regulon response regulator PhoB
MDADRPSVDSFEQPAPSNGGQVQLTATESRLLEVLRSQPGRVFSRSELVALVMPDAVVLERTIDVHIRALRQKLGPLGRQIGTVRNAGYRFTAEPPPSESSE